MTTLVANYGYIHNNQSPQEWGTDEIIETVADPLNWLPTLTALK